MTDSTNPLREVSSTVVETLIKNRERFRGYLTRRIGNEAIAEEVLQQSLLKAVDTPRSRSETTLFSVISRLWAKRRALPPMNSIPPFASVLAVSFPP